jgi:GH25 family lysozyme M1 (1,4-beta-N-acetylmuramidase)
MKVSALSIALALSIASAAPVTTLEERISRVQGFDISNYQHTVDFQAAYNSGARFVIIKVDITPDPLNIYLSILFLVSF